MQRRKARSKESRWRPKLLLTVAVTILLITGLAAWSTQNYLWRFPVLQSTSHPRALIVDELSLNYPDPSFVSNVTVTLTAKGYTVDYVGPSTTAVDYFRQLPGQGYDLVIIRAHEGSGQSIITTEPYSRSQYLVDQLAGRIVPAQVGAGPAYFALTAKFVRQDMTGRFPESTIIVMGCAALQGTQDMAAAFLDKGANFFVGWDGSVSIIHTDTSTVSLVRLLSSGTSVPEATRLAGGEDPVYEAKLGYLDWNALVQTRANNLLAETMVWITLTAILVIGPLAVFASPRLLNLFEHLREAVSRRRTKTNN